MPRLRAALVLVFALVLTPTFADEHLATLWELQGSHNRIFLLGSIHLLRASDYPIPEVIYSTYDEAETLVMELDMDDLDPLQTQMMVQELGMIADGRSLKDVLGRSNYAKARRMADKIQFPLASLARFEPWLAAVTIETAMMMRLGFEISQGIESHLMARATRDHKEIIGLETERQQFEMLDSLSPVAQREMLLQTLAEVADLEDVFNDVIEAWRHGDTAFMEETLLEDMKAFEELYETIVADRNRRWVSQIEALLDDDDDYLVIVGTLHLVGENGVPNLLRKRGHAIQQMKHL